MAPVPAAAIETAFLAANRQTNFSKSEQRYDGVVGGLDGGPLGFLNQFYNDNQEMISSAALSIANIDSKAVESVINNFAETAKVVMKGLDAVAQVHPFIGVAVVAFKLVVTLDMTRRENNRKVIALKAEMQEMMTVLFQLRHISDPDEIGPDGSTLAGRMQNLMEEIARDITNAGSACDAYIKKGFLARTIKSKIYEGRLAEWGAKFEAHRVSLERALTVHTALGVDAANQKLDGQEVQLRAIQNKLEQLFTKLDTPREREVHKFIDENGGAKACIEKEDLLNKMITKSGESMAAVAGTNRKRAGDDLIAARKSLLREYNEDVDELFKRNAVLFEKKLDIQRAQLESAIRNEGDRVIETLLAGAHDRIIDQDLQKIWKEMGWKGSVKARHFVLALHDFYVDRIAQSMAVTPIDGQAPELPAPGSNVAFREPPPDDEWALAYINATHVQPILEAIDDDGTGFISIKEVNTFARSRPAGWTLLQWLAYWAAGWHVGISEYKNKIYLSVQQILALVDKVLPANRRLMDDYLNQYSISRLELFLRSTQAVNESIHLDPQLLKVTHAYDEQEEERLERNLSSVGFEIDSLETVSLVTGPGRIERYAYPLFYCLLQHHLQVMMAGCKYVLDEDELERHTRSLSSVFRALDERMQSLAALFRQSYGDVRARLENISFGMFQSIYGQPRINIAENTWYKWENQAAEVDEEQNLQNLIDEHAADNRKYLKYDVLDFSSFDADDPLPNDISGNHPLLGTWSGHLFMADEAEVANGLFEIVITSVDKEGEIEGKAQSYRGTLEVTGTYKTGSPDLLLVLTYGNGDRVQCNGKFEVEKAILLGTWEAEYSYSENNDDSDEEDGDEDESSENNEAADSDNAPPEEEEEEGQDEEEDGAGDEEQEDQQDEDDEEDESGSGDEDNHIFRFSRTPAYAQRFRPTSAAYKENPARERWNFALEAVLYDVRRGKWSSSLLMERIKEGRRFIDLCVKDEMHERNFTPSGPLDEDEGKEWSRLRRNIHPRSAQVFKNLAHFHVYRESIWHVSYYCDACDRELFGDGLICLVCIVPDYSDRIDLCRSCMNDDEAERDGFVHKSTHSLVKSSYFVHDPQLAWVVGEARSIAERAKTAIQNNMGTTSGGPSSAHGVKSKISCEFCKTQISTPFWVCVNCSHDTYICVDCEIKKPDTGDSVHEWDDVLVRIQDSNADPTPDDGKSSLDMRIAALEVKVEQRLSTLETNIKQRLARMEELMQKIASHIITA